MHVYSPCLWNQPEGIDNMLQPNFRYLALEGGGSKGFIYLGVAESLDKLGILKSIEEIAGASVGAMGALLLSTGWPVPKMQKLFDEINFSQMASGGWFEKLTGFITFIRHFGLHRADRFHDLFKKIIKEVTGNENTTFAQWHEFRLAHPELNLKDISVEACNLNTKLNETFSWRTEHADVPIADAVRASMGFPVYFSPWPIKGCLYGDGGEQNNCPSTVFEKEEGEFNPEVLSVRLDSMDEIRYFKYGVKPPPSEINTGLQCTFAHFESALNSQNRMFFQSPYKNTTVFCDTLNVSTLKFDLDQDTRTALRKSGEYGVIRYFHKHFPAFVESKYGEHIQTLAQIKKAEHPICFTEFVSKATKRMKLTAVGSPANDALAAKDKPLFHQWCTLPAMQNECKKFKHVNYVQLAKEQKAVAAKQRLKLSSSGSL